MTAWNTRLRCAGQLLGPTLGAELRRKRLGQRREAGDVGEQRRALDAVGQRPRPAASARRRSRAMYASGTSQPDATELQPGSFPIPVRMVTGGPTGDKGCGTHTGLVTNRRYNSRVASTAGTQRIVSVAVADVVGSTAIGERLGPARSKFLFDEVTALMAAEVRRFDGTVAQLTGDGLLAVFGAPLAHEDDAERGVRAALAIQSAIASYADEVREAYDIDLAVRVAVNSGPVVLTDVDVDDAERYNALGDTVNVAARLQNVDAEGGIVIGPETARQLQDCFELEELGDVELKGVERPVRAFRVTGERGPAHIRAGGLAGRARRRARRAGRGVRGDGGGQRHHPHHHRRAGHRQDAPAGRGAAAGGRPRLLPGGSRDLVLRRARRTGRCATCCATGSASPPTRPRPACAWS